MACMTDSATLACSIRAATDALLTADEAWAAEARRGLRAALCALENALAATQRFRGAVIESLVCGFLLVWVRVGTLHVLESLDEA